MENKDTTILKWAKIDSQTNKKYFKKQPTNDYVPVLFKRITDNKLHAISPRTIKLPITKVTQKETKPELWKDSKQLQEKDEKETIKTIIDECLKVITKQEEALSKQEFKDNFRNTFQTNKARKIYNLALMCFKDIENYKKLEQLNTDLLYEIMYTISNVKKHTQQSLKKAYNNLKQKDNYIQKHINTQKNISRFKTFCNKKQVIEIEDFFNERKFLFDNNTQLEHLKDLTKIIDKNNKMKF